MSKSPNGDRPAVTESDDSALLDKLNRIWQRGEEEEGEDEHTGAPMYRRMALLVAIRSRETAYPDVRTLIRDMPEPTPHLVVVQ